MTLNVCGYNVAHTSMPSSGTGTRQRSYHGDSLEAMRDPTMKVIASFIENVWPRYERSIAHSVRDYFRGRSSLSISDGLIIYKLQIVVPPNMHTGILQRLHETHQGISKCRERAAASVWWPGIAKLLPHLSKDAKPVDKTDQHSANSHCILRICTNYRDRKVRWISASTSEITI